MTKITSSLLLLICFNLSALDLVDNLNILIQHDLNFIQKSINPKTNKVDNSSGNVIRKNDVITINVDTPFKERYKIKQDVVEVYDYDFDETKTILLEDINARSMSLLIKGISQEDVSSYTENTLYLNSEIDDVYIELISDKTFVIKFIDNLGINNIINFEAIK
ncbi:hypothetical protein OAE42_02335 [Gammaproteobacteria bacterium]|nr:hypothetical protein [Gammaproteobacteria bacterium]MDC0005531.1 hypothetical protein [Gammaproteobacteria bacterium]MDC3325263.1 hypothetical protein [Gammaproteobacteria bacterium]|tara:strand:- start:1318 stop:1806 length:489 start_codon:yes stop_codon:yes gene_type:complete